MRIYEMIKAAVPVPEAAEHYGMEVGRNHMTCCPFHSDQTPSMKLNERYYYCFGCGAHGDVVSLIAQLLGIGSYEAAKKLAVDFGIDPDKPPTAGAMIRISLPRQEESRCYRVLVQYLHRLEDWKKRYAPMNPEEKLDEHFIEAWPAV